MKTPALMEAPKSSTQAWFGGREGGATNGSVKKIHLELTSFKPHELFLA